jgi:hypothetical protein
LAEVNREVEVCLLWIVLSLRLLTDDIPFWEFEAIPLAGVWMCENRFLVDYAVLWPLEASNFSRVDPALE